MSGHGENIEIYCSCHIWTTKNIEIQAFATYGHEDKVNILVLVICGY